MPADLAPQGDGATPTVPLLGGATPRRSRFRYFWLIGIVIYLAAVWYVGWDKFREAFSLLRPVSLLWVAAVLLAAIWLRVLKWRLALGLRPITQLYFLSKAGGEITPSRVGELSPLLLRKFRSPRVAAWIVLDRMIEIAATLAYGAFGAITLQSDRSTLLQMVGVASVLLVVLPTALITRQGFFLWLAGRTREGRALNRIASFLAVTSGEFRQFRPLLPVAVLLTLLTTGLDIFSGVLVYGAFGQHLSFALLAAAQCIHGVIAAIPFLPGLTGVPYAAVAAFLNQVAGVPLGVIAAVVTVYVLLGSTIFWGSLGVSALRWGTDTREEQAGHTL
jgi:hypothetical protein